MRKIMILSLKNWATRAGGGWLLPSVPVDADGGDGGGKVVKEGGR